MAHSRTCLLVLALVLGARAVAAQTVVITSDLASPQPVSTTINLTATVTGGTPPFTYRWLVYTGSQWLQIMNWSTNAQVPWTPTATMNGWLQVQVRNSGSTAEVYDAMDTHDYVITDPLPSVSLAANPPSGQWINHTVTWTASGTGGVAPLEYKFRLFDGTTWTTLQDWDDDNTYDWTPTVASATYEVHVWVRNAGVTDDAPQASDEVDYAIADDEVYFNEPFTDCDTSYQTGTGNWNGVYRILCPTSSPALAGYNGTSGFTPTGSIISSSDCAGGSGKCFRQYRGDGKDQHSGGIKFNIEYILNGCTGSGQCGGINGVQTLYACYKMKLPPNITSTAFSGGVPVSVCNDPIYTKDTYWNVNYNTINAASGFSGGANYGLHVISPSAACVINGVVKCNGDNNDVAGIFDWNALDGPGTVGTTSCSDNVIPSGQTWHTIEMEAHIDASPNGYRKVWVDGTQIQDDIADWGAFTANSKSWRWVLVGSNHGAIDTDGIPGATGGTNDSPWLYDDVYFSSARPAAGTNGAPTGCGF